MVVQEEGDLIRVQVQPDERLNRDFILRYAIVDERINLGALASADDDNPQEGTLMCILTAPKQDTRGLTPRDFVFVIDRSGSMEGWKIGAARRAVGRLLDSFTSQDRFALLAFDNAIQAYNNLQFVQADNTQRYRAIEWLSHIRARGGTEVMNALMNAVQRLQSARPDALRAIVLVTDGQVGNEDEIIRWMNKAGVTMFVVGVDIAVNDALLTRLAEETGGT